MSTILPIQNNTFIPQPTADVCKCCASVAALTAIKFVGALLIAAGLGLFIASFAVSSTVLFASSLLLPILGLGVLYLGFSMDRLQMKNPDDLPDLAFVAKMTVQSLSAGVTAKSNAVAPVAVTLAKENAQLMTKHAFN